MDHLWTQRNLLSGLCVAILVVTSVVGWNEWRVDAADEDLSLHAFMRKKLDASSQILEGLTVEDAAMVARGAKSLLELSNAEKWQILVDAQYREHSLEYRRTVKKLLDAAEKTNLDKATLQWFDVTKSCIECHQDVRGSRAARKP